MAAVPLTKSSVERKLMLILLLLLCDFSPGAVRKAECGLRRFSSLGRGVRFQGRFHFQRLSDLRASLISAFELA